MKEENMADESEKSRPGSDSVRDPDYTAAAFEAASRPSPQGAARSTQARGEGRSSQAERQVMQPRRGDVEWRYYHGAVSDE
jgi:hypothetical protein